MDTSELTTAKQESRQDTIDHRENVEKQDTGGGAVGLPTADASGGASGGAHKKTHQIPRYGNTGIPKPYDKRKKERNRSPISAP